MVIRLPLEIIKSRTQTAAYGPDTTLRKSLRMVWRNEGLKGFWRGYGGTLARDASRVMKRSTLKWLPMIRQANSNLSVADPVYYHSIPVVRAFQEGPRSEIPKQKRRRRADRSAFGPSGEYRRWCSQSRYPARRCREDEDHAGSQGGVLPQVIAWKRR